MQDNNFAYNVGDEYPRKGLKALASENNRQGCPLIVEVEDTKIENTKKKSKTIDNLEEE